MYVTFTGTGAVPGMYWDMKGYSDSPAFVSVKVAETQIPKLSYHNNIIKYMASYRL